MRILIRASLLYAVFGYLGLFREPIQVAHLHYNKDLYLVTPPHTPPYR